MRNARNASEIAPALHQATRLSSLISGSPLWESILRWSRIISIFRPQYRRTACFRLRWLTPNWSAAKLRDASQGGSHEEGNRVRHRSGRERRSAGRDEDRDAQGERLEVRPVPGEDRGQGEGFGDGSGTLRTKPSAP